MIRRPVRRRRFLQWDVAYNYATLRAGTTGRRMRVERERFTVGELWTVQEVGA